MNHCRLPLPGSSMREQSILCYITDRSAFDGDEGRRSQSLLEKIAEAARAGVDFVQLREKDLSGRELEKLTRAAVETLQNHAGESCRTKLLVNGRVDVALAAGADGVHLPANDLSVSEVRGIWAHAGRRTTPTISIACHLLEEVRAAAESSADFVIFAPVFGKKDAPGVPAAGLKWLREASSAALPVLALGGVTFTNTRACLEAGAAGIAAIRLFQENDIGHTVGKLREMFESF